MTAPAPTKASGRTRPRIQLARAARTVGERPRRATAPAITAPETTTTKSMA